MIITNSAEIRAALEHDQEAEDEVRDQAARSQQELMLTATQELPALPNFEETGLWSLIAAWSELPMQNGHALEYAARVESCIGEIMRAYARAASAAVQAELNAAQAIIADRDAAEEERIFAKPLRTVDSKEPIGKLCIEDGNRTRTVHSEWAEGAFALPAGEYAIYGHPTVAAQSQQEPVAWKQAFEEEARKFQQETLRTSKMTELLWRWIERASALGCTHIRWTKACITCDLMRESKELVETPINASPPPAAQPASEHAIRESAHHGGVDAMTKQLREILDGGICLASNPPELAELAARLATQSAEVPEDVRRDAGRLDWLAMQVVTVRTPLLYGSRAAFIAGADHDDPSDAPSPSGLRIQIDDAMLAGKEKS